MGPVSSIHHGAERDLNTKLAMRHGSYFITAVHQRGSGGPRWKGQPHPQHPKLPELVLLWYSLIDLDSN